VLQSAGLALLIGALLAAVQYHLARTGAVPTILQSVDAESPDSTDRYHVRFRNTVSEMRLAAGIPRDVRPVIARSFAMSAFAAEDVRNGIVVGVTEGLLSTLNRSQLQAVVAHELAHVREGDARITAFSCALLAPFLNLYELVESLGKDAPRHQQSGAPTALLWMITGLMRLVSTTVSRRRELLADATAVELTRNPMALAEALWIVSKGNHFMGGAATAFSPIFVVDPTSGGIGEEEGAFPDLFATHPPLRTRLDALLDMVHCTMDQLEAQMKMHAESRRDQDTGRIPGIGHCNRNWISPLAVSADGIPRHGKCPACACALRLDDWSGVEVLRCPECRGNLVDERKLPRILLRRETRFHRSQREEALASHPASGLRSQKTLEDGTQAQFNCPACTAPMTRQFYSYQYNIVVDRCFACKAVWFDADELETLWILIDSANQKDSPVTKTPA
jgi:heat shock protein HtpX